MTIGWFLDLDREVSGMGFGGYDDQSIYKNYYMSGMKGESLLSNISNLSYHLEAGVYVGSDFFKESLLGNSQKNKKSKSVEEVGIDSLAMSALGNLNAAGEPVGAFTMCWTNDGKNVEGVSDEEVDIEKSPAEVKEEEQPRFPEPMLVKKEEQSPEKDNASQQHKVKNSKFKNQTKNIPKNYGKAIIIFIEKNKQKLLEILEAYNVEYFDLIEQLQQKKKSINTIADLRKMWMQSEFSNVMRVISNLFMRKHSLPYIFNSRIKSRQCHIKYKKRLQEALKNPSQFQHIKDY